MTPEESTQNNAAVGSLLFTNVIFGIIQFNVASIFVYIGADLHEGVSGLGLLAAAFFLGIGLFEVGGSVISARVGTKNVLVLGTTISALAMLVSAIAPDFNLLVILRLLAGLGTGFAFPPVVVLLARHFRKGQEGLAVGLVNLAYNFGGILGLFGWAVLGLVIGWRYSLLIGGIANLLAVLFLYFSLPGDRNPSPGSPRAITTQGLRRTLLNRHVLLLSLCLFGFGATAALTWNFIVFYLEETLRVAPPVAGLVGSLSNLFTLISSPFVGRAYDRTHRTKTFLVVASLVMALGVAVTSVGDFAFAVASAILVGTATGIGWTVGLAAAREASFKDPRMEGVAVGFVDSISLLGSFVSPIFFSFVVVVYGYPLSWLMGSLFAIFFVLPLIFLSTQKVGLLTVRKGG